MLRVLIIAGLASSLLAACGAGRNVAAPETEREAGAVAEREAYAPFSVAFMETDLLSEAIDRAASEDKLVFIDFYTTWCLPCKLMDEDVFTDPAFGRYMNERFVSLKVDAERGNGVNLAALYEVQAYPTLLFVDTRGRVVGKKQGAAYQRELRALGEAALATVP